MTDEIVLYKPNDQLSIEVKLENETVWHNQQQMAQLFNTSRNNITLHISNIFKEQELDPDSVCKESLLTAADGKTYRTKFYNLDVIISVGYRVKSIKLCEMILGCRKFCDNSYGVPTESVLSHGESEGTIPSDRACRQRSRFNERETLGLCDLVAERDCPIHDVKPVRPSNGRNHWKLKN